MTDFGERALNKALASYRRNREIWLQEKAKEIREEKAKEAATCLPA